MVSGHWVYGEIDWQEFWRVVKGNGPCNRERLEARRAAHEGGRWVREALEAYANKKNPSVAIGSKSEGRSQTSHQQR
jgi:ring-1,2-phenylacetyl-CoA epoxidase subunit PaaA